MCGFPAALCQCTLYLGASGKHDRTYLVITCVCVFRAKMHAAHWGEWQRLVELGAFV